MEQNKGTAQATQGAEGQNGNSIPQSNVLLLHIQRAGSSYQVTYEGKQRGFASPWKKGDLLAQLYRARVLAFTKQEARTRGIDLAKLPQLYPRKARAALREMGDQLYEALFPSGSPICQTLETRLQEAVEQGRTLSLRLQLDPDDAELWAFPWELLYAHWIEASGEIHATFTQTLNALAIIRYLPKKEAKPIFTRLQRIAFFAASPKGGTIPTHQTFEAIRSAWGVDRVSTSAGQSWADWETLMAQNPDAVHFLGHGHGNENDQLAFVGEGNSPDLKGADKITNSLPATLKLLTLQACSSSHLAATLIQKHPQLPIAVGMHYEIGTEVADAFALGFYRTLLTSGRVEAAIAQARQHMLESSRDNQWLLPIQTMGVPEAYFSSKVFPKVSRRLPTLTHAVEREQLPTLQEKLFQHPLLALAGKPGSGRTWLALQALEKAGVEKKLLFDLSQGGDIYALWHALLNAFELPQVQHLYAPELTEERWQAMKKGLSEALQKEPHALLIKLPAQPPQDAQKEGWQHLFEALRAAKAPQEEHSPSQPPSPQAILILDQGTDSVWRDLIGEDATWFNLNPWSRGEITALLQTYGLSQEKAEAMGLSACQDNISIWKFRQWLASHSGKDADELRQILEREGFSLQGRWEKFSPLEQEVLKWAAIVDASLTPTDLLSLLNQRTLSLDTVKESLDALTQAEWLRPEESGYRLVPAARSFVREQMEKKERRQRLRRWHRHQALVEQAANVETLLDDDDLEEAANLLLSETWHPWQISPSYRYKLLEFIDELWEERDALPSDIPFKLAMRVALAARALGDYQAAIRWYERADEAASTPEEHLQALIEMAFLRHRTGSLDERLLKEIEDYLKEVQNPQLHAQWFFTLATIYGERSQYPKAIQSIERGKERLDRNSPLKQMIQRILYLLKRSKRSALAQAVKNISSIHSALEQWVQQGGPPLLAAQAMRAYGVALLHTSSPRAALEAFKSSTRFYRDAGDTYMEGVSLLNTSVAYLHLGEPQEAAKLRKQAKNILDRLGDPAFERFLRYQDEAIAMLSEPCSFQEILGKLQQALSIVDQYGYERYRVDVLLEMARAYTMRGEWTKAEDTLRQAIDLSREDPSLFAWSHFFFLESRLYRLEYHRRTHRSSITLTLTPLQEALRALSQDADPELFLASDILFALHALLQENPELEQARAYLQQWEKPMEKEDAFDVDIRLKWYDIQGLLSTALSDLEKAADAPLEKAVYAFEKGLALTGAIAAYRAQLRYHYAQALFRSQSFDQAQEQLEQALEEAEQMEIPWLKAMIQALQAQIADPAS